ncbi:hypothetical protein AAFF_G00439910 [Aldrovandia affinis]|uniref:Uncharacterized protein n=1 Tax=Aldrovandia affinis TaxID=143900 RepID=A0AAD7VYB3_9TELE|nr:hypothetical protein AAFF_G00439910 [Aldrovandia affinis]
MQELSAACVVSSDCAGALPVQRGGNRAVVPGAGDEVAHPAGQGPGGTARRSTAGSPLGVPLLLPLLLVAVVTLLQSRWPRLLPAALRSWDFLPAWSRSLETHRGRGLLLLLLPWR